MYVEPDWIDDVKKAAASTHYVGKDVTRMPEYVLLRTSMEGTIESQKKEIECLRAQLAAASESAKVSPIRSATKEEEEVGVSTLKTELLDEATSSAISILRKLDSTDSQAQTPEVLNDNFYSLKGFRYLKKVRCSEAFVGKLYSWLNIIKLDPQLTGLWFKITSLQKSYHMYKTSLLSRPDRAVYGTGECPVAKSHGDNGPSCGHHQCPVVECEFNLMVEESSDRTSTPMGHSQSRLKNESAEDTPSPRDTSAQVLSQLHRLWSDIISYGRGLEQLTYDQIVFLVQFYLNLSHVPSSLLAYEFESRNLFRFYRDDILCLFTKVGGNAHLDLSAFDSKVSEAESISLGKIKGIYLCMLGLIVEESLDILRRKSGKPDELLSSFHQLFPLEAVHHGMGYKRTSFYDQARDFLKICTSTNRGDELSDLLPCIAISLGYLNRCIALYLRPGNTSDVRLNFIAIFTRVLDVFDKDDSRLRLWADPSHIRFNGAHMSDARQRELRLHLSHLWVDFMRLINHVTFNFIPMLKHSEKLDKRIESFFENIHEATENHDHVKYVSKQKLDSGDDHIPELLASLHVYYLSSRIFLILRKSTCRLSGSSVTIGDLQKLTKDITAWTEDITLTKLRITRYFEIRSMFQYLDFYISFIVFLQCEEDADYESACIIIPSLFSKALDLVNFLQESVKQFSKSDGSQYVLAAVAEMLSRVSHLIVGLLIRFKREESGEYDSSETLAPTSLVYTAVPDTMRQFTISVQLKEQLIQVTDSLLIILESLLNRENFTKVSKIWKFYMTFVRNSHRMNPAAYARIHADVFKSGKLMDACPVLPSPAKVSDTRYNLRKSQSSFSGCPVNHVDNGTASMDHFTNHGRTSSNGGFLVDSTPHMGHNQNDSLPNNKKRRCPLDHESLRMSGKTPSFQESNIRSSPVDLKNDMAIDGKPSALPMTNMAPAMMPSRPTSNPPFQFPPPSPGPVTMDWDNLPNFNFDLFPDESLMVQFGPGDLNNPKIEGIFQ